MASKPSKRWCFTINNWTQECLITMKTVPCIYMIIGKEVGASGTPHLQGFVTFQQAKRLSAMKKIHPKAHWTEAKGSSFKASEYCKKEGDYEEFGEVPSQGKRTDLESAAAMIVSGKSIREVAEEHPAVFIKFHRGIAALKSELTEPTETTTTRGIWLVGQPGVGKSYLVRKTLGIEDKLYVKQQNKWWDNYQGENYVLIDDLDHGASGLGHLMKLWTDRYTARGEIKGSSTSLSYSVLFVTSNYLPSEIWQDEQMVKAISRRFDVHTVGEHNRDVIADRIKESIDRKEQSNT